MPRIAGAVLLGYLAMFATVFVALIAAYLVLGPERAFRPGVYDASVPWMAINIAVIFGAAYLGGMLANRVSGGERAPGILAVVVLLLGFWIALPALFAEPGILAARTGDVGPLQALQLARPPMWLALMYPFIGAVGVIVGGQDMDAVAGAKPVPAQGG